MTDTARPDAPPAVSCQGLRHTYRDALGRRAHEALRGVDLTVRAGESYALLGPNGSGKTTCLRLLLGLVRPTGGSVALFGRSPTESAARARVGFLPERSALHQFLTATETLDLFARLRGVAKSDRKSRIDRLLTELGLTDFAKRRVHALSHGTRRRLALATALIAEPELLILDEPTSGMDPLVREKVLALLRAHRERGGTLLVTSHLLGDIAGIADRAGLLADGRIVREGDLAEMLRRAGLRRALVRGGDDVDAALGAAALAAGGEVVECGPAQATIEELFLETYRLETYRERQEDA